MIRFGLSVRFQTSALPVQSRLVFIVFTFLSADCSARVFSDGTVSAQHNTPVGRRAARLVYPAHFDSDFYLPKYGIRQHLVCSSSGGFDFDVFHRWN